MLGARMIEKIVPERLRGDYARLLERFASTGSWPVSGSRELTALHADGREFPVEATIGPLRVGEHLLLNAFVRDATERKRAEAYRDAQHRVTRGLANATSLEEAREVVLHNLGPALGFNFGATLQPGEGDDHLQVSGTWSGADGAHEQLAATAEGLVIGLGEGPAGRAWATGEPVFVADVAKAAPAGELQRAAAAAGLRSGVAFPVVHGDEFLGAGVFYWDREQALDPELLAMLAAVGTQIGQFIARKRAEAEADRLKDEFFALVSHELRTPLTSIIGYLELVLEDETLETDPRRFLEVVQRNADRLLRLVGDLLFVAQFEAGNLSLEPRPVDLADVCSEAVEAARPKAHARGIELVLDADGVPAVTADAGRLGQALDNLVSNALKFTPAGGSVEVRLTAVGDEALIEVADSGSGISADEQERLFDRFFRSAQAHEQAVQGVGLGLTIVKAIVDGHGGRIAVRSEVGAGSTFTVALPLNPVASSPELTEGHIEVHS
jgi:signal transduction histidine kinase